jgi:hypothetical protein
LIRNFPIHRQEKTDSRSSLRLGLHAYIHVAPEEFRIELIWPDDSSHDQLKQQRDEQVLGQISLAPHFLFVPHAFAINVKNFAKSSANNVLLRKFLLN